MPRHAAARGRKPALVTVLAAAAVVTFGAGAYAVAPTPVHPPAGAAPSPSATVRPSPERSATSGPARVAAVFAGDSAPSPSAPAVRSPVAFPSSGPAGGPAVLAIPATTTVPGAPAITWPTQGQAAVEISGRGALAGYGPVGTGQPIASVTKTMTAYLILRDHPLSPGQQGPSITVTSADVAAYDYDVSQNMSVAKVAAGEQLTENEALEALMLPSADNVADILAGWDAGSESAFVAKMNAEAAALGMTQTSYADASGYDPDSASTATDLIKLAHAAMVNPYFTQLVAQTSAVIPVAGTVTNTDSLLGTDGIDGIKTGSTSQAGGCLLFSAVASVGGQSVGLVGSVLGQDAPNGTELALGLKVAKAVVASAESQLAVQTLVPATTVVATQRLFFGGTRQLHPVSALTVVGWPGETFTLQVGGTPAAPVLEAVAGTTVVGQVALA